MIETLFKIKWRNEPLKNELLIFVVAVLALSALLQWASSYLGYKRYFLSVELVFAFALYFVGAKWLAIFAAIAAIAQELFLGMASILYLFDYDQVLTISGFAFDANLKYVAMVGVILFSSALLICAAFKQLNFLRWQSFVVVVTAFVICQVFVSLREGNFIYPTVASRNGLVLGSSTFFVREVLTINRAAFDLKSHDNVDYIPIKYPSAANQAFGGDTPYKKTLFIVAESWGLPKNRAVLDQQIISLRGNEKIQLLSLGSINAVGVTAFAEFRELCGKVPTKLHMHKISKLAVGECLPEKLKNLGFKTMSVHGASKHMYDREIWYPVMGFEKMFFDEDLRQISGSRCYSFPGSCDRNLFQFVSKSLTGDEKKFLYWMTLNSHVPYDRRDIFSYRKEPCNAVFGDAYTDQLCNYQNLQTQFFEGLSSMLKRAEIKDVEVVMVGDHAPLFNDEDSRSRFEAKQVPMLHLRVK